MPRQARLDAPGTLHHIMIRGIEGRDLFNDEQDREEFVDRLSKIVQKTGDKIVAWVLMSNHIHLLVFSGQYGISKFMRCLLTGYALWYNRKYKRIGHLLQNRYKSIVCEEEPYLLELIRYIHLNPLRANVVKSLKELDNHPWNGHSVLIGKVRNIWQDKDYVLSQFGNREKTAVKAYCKFIDEGINQGNRPELTGGGLIRSLGGWSQVLSLRGNKQKIDYDARILGGSDFVGNIMKEADKNLKRQLRLNEKNNMMDKMIKKACKEEGISEQELRGGGRRKIISNVRAKIAYNLSQELGSSAAEIARNLGVCTSSIVKAIQNQEMGK